MPWLLNEDAAMKAKLQGLSVSDVNAAPQGRAVPVKFNLPEDELSDTAFPMIVIDPPSISKASDREHRGPVTLPYMPEGTENWQPLFGDAKYGDGAFGGGAWVAVPGLYDDSDIVDGGIPIDHDDVPGFYEQWDVSTDFDPSLSPFRSDDYPIPYNLDYAVTVYTRKQTHIQQLVNSLAVIDRLPFRFGYLEIPQDGTVRTLEVINSVAIDTFRDSDGKRSFRADYAVRVATELTPYAVTQLANTYVTEIDISVSEI